MLNLARAEADPLGRDWVGCEHLLLGLLRDADSEFARECAEAGITLQATRAELQRIVGPQDTPITTVSPYSPRLKRVLEEAECVAALNRSTTLEPDHFVEVLVTEDRDAVCLIALRNVHGRSQ